MYDTILMPLGKISVCLRGQLQSNNALQKGGEFLQWLLLYVDPTFEKVMQFIVKRM